MTQIGVGTSGYAYHDWVGPVYPPGTAPEDYAARYAALFSTVELNASKHRMPRAEHLSRLLDQAPGLSFSLKVTEDLIRSRDAAERRRSAGLFRRALEPLLRASRLDALLFQFPEDFVYGPDERRALDALLREFDGLPAAVEFRNRSWYSSRVLDALRKRAIALAAPELPPAEGMPSFFDVATAPLAYLRLDGGRGTPRWGSDSAARYDYLYSDGELGFLLERIRALSACADRVLVYFNNCLRGHAAVNARSLSALLGRAASGS